MRTAIVLAGAIIGAGLVALPASSTARNAGVVAPRSALPAARPALRRIIVNPRITGIPAPRAHVATPAFVHTPHPAVRPFVNHRAHLLDARHHRRVLGFSLPLTTRPGVIVLGSYYDPTDIASAYANTPTADIEQDAPALDPALAARYEVARQPRVCSTEHVTVPSPTGDRDIRIIRC